MLSEGIMHECIRRLLQSTTDEEALECFAKLMFTIGKDLDHEKGQVCIVTSCTKLLEYNILGTH